MRSFKIKLLIFSLLAYAVVILVSLGLYERIKTSGNIIYTILYFVFIFVIVSLILYLAFREVDKKYNDIESSKRQYYYVKPFIFQIDKEGNIVKVNKEVEEKIRDYDKYQNIYDLDVELKEVDLLDELNRQTPINCTFKSKNNDNIIIRFIPVRQGKIIYLIGEDITEHKKEFAYYKKLALYGKLTNLPNRNYLVIQLKEILDNINIENSKNSLVLFDIVGFKNINKLFGYKIADETIKVIANITIDNLEGYDAQLFNLELDKFAILFKNIARYQDVIEWIDRFSRRFEKAIRVQDSMFTVKIKAGVFNIEKDKNDELKEEDIIESANIALRKAKESRMLNYVVYDMALGKNFTRTQVMEVDLANAIKNNEFVMFLQPQLDNKKKKIVGFEALIRWDNPKYEFESPAKFLEIAEKNNYIVDIGRYIINETFKIAKDLEDFDVRISINISPIQLLQTGFVYEIISTFNTYRLKKGSIILEITETFLMESLDEIVDKLNIIRKSGIHIHLDNFGTGYSSMLYLKELPIDSISINKEFIKELNNDQFSRSIIIQIIKLAESLGLEVIAEGVEDEKQNQFLVSNGCHVVQGYYFSRPLPKDEAIKLMIEYNRKGINY